MRIDEMYQTVNKIADAFYVLTKRVEELELELSDYRKKEEQRAERKRHATRRRTSK